MRHIELVYPSCNDRMSFLESLCVGKAKDVIVGLLCLVDRAYAYEKAWSRLEKRFGDTRKPMDCLQDDLLEGPVMKGWDAERLTKICNRMYKCEVSF